MPKPNYYPRGNQPPRGGQGGRGHGGRQETLPDECKIRDSFYDGGNLKHQIFLDAADSAERVFSRGKMSQSSIRSLFNMLKAMERRIATETEQDLPLGVVQECYLKFYTLCIYQEKRDIIPRTFLEFAEHHRDIAMKDRKEFQGFVEYLTSIMVRMKSK